MSKFGVSIRKHLLRQAELRKLAAQAAKCGAAYIGFYFDAKTGCWSFWSSDAADSGSGNHVYTPGQIKALLSVVPAC